MEGGEVEGDIRTEIGQDPVSQFASFVGIVVKRRNHQVSQFDPNRSFLLQPDESVENRLKMREGDFAVEILGEGLEVHVGGVDVVVDVVESFVSDVTVGDHDGFQTVGFGGFADVDDVFAPDGGLVVSESDRIAMIFPGKQRNLLRWKMFGPGLVVMGFGDVPILAEETPHVATGGAHAEDSCARQEVVERLLLNGINLESGRGGVAEGVQFAVLIDADVAEAGLSVANVAVARAEVTMDAAVGIDFPPSGFVEGGGGLKDLERRHDAVSDGRLYAMGKDAISNQ